MPIRAVAVSPDGAQIVCGEIDGTVRVWDRATGRQFGDPLRGHLREVHTLAFVLNGTRIVSASLDGTVRVWDRVTGLPVGELFGPAHVMAVTPDGTQIVSGDVAGSIQVRSLLVRRPVAAVPLAEVVSDLESEEDRLNIAGM